MSYRPSTGIEKNTTSSFCRAGVPYQDGGGQTRRKGRSNEETP